MYHTRGDTRRYSQASRVRVSIPAFPTILRYCLVAQLNGLNQRNDVRPLWENFMFVEQLKARSYGSLYANLYLWRTYDQQEIDLVEERDGRLFSYEFKWSQSRPVAAPKAWKNAYPDSDFKLIHPNNYLDFLLP